MEGRGLDWGAGRWGVFGPFPPRDVQGLGLERWRYVPSDGPRVEAWAEPQSHGHECVTVTMKQSLWRSGFGVCKKGMGLGPQGWHLRSLALEQSNKTAGEQGRAGFEKYSA